MGLPQSPEGIPQEYPENPETLWGLLQRAAAKWPKNGLLFRDKGLKEEPLKTTYSSLLSQATANGMALRNAGLVNPGEVVLIYFETHRENIIWTWSVIALGGIPAILPPVSHDEKTKEAQLENLQTLFGQPLLLTTKLLKSKFKGIRMKFIEDIPTVTKRAFEMPAVNSSPDSLAALLFTSGSTGHSKAVEIRHRQVILSARAKQEIHGTTSESNFLAWISFDHSANFCELHINAMNSGSNQVHLRTLDVIEDPKKFYQALSIDKIAYSFGPNFFISAATKGALTDSTELDLSLLRVLMVGGEANRTSTIDEADKFIRSYGAPENAIKAAYGLSETCSACFYNLKSPEYDTDKLFSTVGKGLSGLELRIVQNDLQPANEGNIHLRGEIVFRRYFNNEAATKSCMTEDGWFDTGDLGRLDENGNLEIIGRTKEILILNGNNYSSFELEHAISSQVENITASYLAAFSVWEKNSEHVVILFNPVEETDVVLTVSKIQQACVKFCSQQPLAVIPLPKSEMPKSTIGKLSRQKLKKHYLEGVFDSHRLLSKSEKGKPITTLIGLAIALALSEETSILSTDMTSSTPIMYTGIDSLSYLRIKKRIEDQLSINAPLPMSLLLGSSTIEELEKALIENSYELTNEYDPIIPLRENGFKTPIFLVHPGGGEFLNWLNVVEHLPDRPIYAFRIRGLPPHDENFQSLQELLDIYEAGMLRVQPKGPYAIVGHCFGGMVAFELAKRLEKRGEKVTFCAGIDNQPDLGRALSSSNFKPFVLKLLALVGLFSIEEAGRLEKEYENISDEPEVFLQHFYKQFPSSKIEELGLTAKKLEGWCRVFGRTTEMSRAYHPEGKIDNYTVFWVPPREKDMLEVWVETVHLWDDFAEKTEYYEVEGDHFTVLKQPHVEAFQRALNLALEKAGV